MKILFHKFCATFKFHLKTLKYTCTGKMEKGIKKMKRRKLHIIRILERERESYRQTCLEQNTVRKECTALEGRYTSARFKSIEIC